MRAYATVRWRRFRHDAAAATVSLALAGGLWWVQWQYAPYWLVRSSAGLETLLQVVPPTIAGVYALGLASVFVIAQTLAPSRGARAVEVLLLDARVRLMVILLLEGKTEQRHLPRLLAELGLTQPQQVRVQPCHSSKVNAHLIARYGITPRIGRRLGDAWLLDASPTALVIAMDPENNFATSEKCADQRRNLQDAIREEVRYQDADISREDLDMLVSVHVWGDDKYELANFTDDELVTAIAQLASTRGVEIIDQSQWESGWGAAHLLILGVPARIPGHQEALMGPVDCLIAGGHAVDQGEERVAGRGAEHGQALDGVHGELLAHIPDRIVVAALGYVAEGLVDVTLGRLQPQPGEVGPFVVCSQLVKRDGPVPGDVAGYQLGEQRGSLARVLHRGGEDLLCLRGFGERVVHSGLAGGHSCSPSRWPRNDAMSRSGRSSRRAGACGTAS
jgi:hypothetical protein